MVVCRCGSPAIKLTSWTVRNPGRQFWRCSRSGTNCGFIGWVDPPMCPRAIVGIPGLLRAMNRLEIEVWKMKMLLLVSWIKISVLLVNVGVMGLKGK